MVGLLVGVVVFGVLVVGGLVGWEREVLFGRFLFGGFVVGRVGLTHPHLVLTLLPSLPFF